VTFSSSLWVQVTVTKWRLFQYCFRLLSCAAVRSSV
jgi:hypothetical protein